MNLKYVELHLHLDGAVRLQTLYDIAVQKKILPDNVETIESFAKYVSLDKKKKFFIVNRMFTYIQTNFNHYFRK